MWKDFVMRWKPEVDRKIKEIYEGKERVVGRFGNINVRALEVEREFTLGGGKRVRPILFIAGYMSQGAEPNEDIIQVAAAIELIHAFLLTHDDIMDRDEFRRGRPTVWKHFENMGFSRHTAYSFAITSGDLIYTYALQAVLSTNLEHEEKNYLIEKMLETVEHTGYGQNLDVYFPERPLEEINIDDVLTVYRQKTGVYTIVFPLTSGAELAGADRGTLEAFRKYGENVGIAFQIHDDILGVFGDPEKTGKPVGSDIREGKKTLLVLEAYRRADKKEKEEIKKYLGTEDEEKIRRVMEIIESTGALDYAREYEKGLVEEGTKALKEANITREIREFLEDFAWYLITREK